MATFAFKALDLAGVSTVGELEADDKQTVASQLRGKGLIVLDIEEKKSGADVGDFFARFKRVKAQDLTIATRQLSTMVSSGMSLLRALYVLEEQTKSDKLREALTEVRKDVEAGISLSVTGQWYIGLALLVGSIVGFRKWKATDKGRAQWDRFKLRVPFKIGDIVQKVALARFSRTYSALIAAGVPMLQAIEITGRTAGNRVVEIAMQQVRESVKGGGTIAQPMRNEPAAFPSMVVQMVAVGEETGALETMLTKVADFYEDEVAASLKALTSILEPLMIIIVGAIVGFIVISMYMPMFKVYDQIR